MRSVAPISSRAFRNAPWRRIPELAIGLLWSHQKPRSLWTDTRRVARLGEYLAGRELERRGYRIVARRTRSRLGEVDLIAWDGSVLVFVEVKTRRGNRYGTPAEAVDRRKQRKLVTLAKAYLARRRWRAVAVRFDVVAVELLEGRRPHVELFRSAFVDE